MYHNVVSSAILLKVELLKYADFGGTVDQSIVVGGYTDGLLHLARCSAADDMQIAQTPTGWNVEQTNAHWLIAQLRRVHQDHGPVEKAVFGVELAAERTGVVEVNVVSDHHTSRRSGDLPL